MSKHEIEMTAKVLTGEESMQEDNGGLNALASIYLDITIFDKEFQSAVKVIVGERFDELLRIRARQKAAFVLEILCKNSVVYDITSYVSFLVQGLPLLGISTEEFISIQDLANYEGMHTYALQSMQAKRFMGSRRSSTIGLVASALLADISAEEIGITQTDAKKVH